MKLPVCNIQQIKSLTTEAKRGVPCTGLFKRQLIGRMVIQQDGALMVIYRL